MSIIKYFGLIVICTWLHSQQFSSMFVANCVQQICDRTSTKQRHFIESSNISADVSCDLDSKMKNQIEVVQWSIIYIVLVAKMWNQWSTCRRSRAEKQLISVNTIQIQENLVLTKLQERISSRTKMKRVVTLILVIKDNC